MKRTILVLGIIVAGLSTALSQTKVKWYSIEEAVKLAAVEPRVLVVDVYTDWCGWCKRMDATTFSDPEIAELLNTHFYPVKLDAEGKEDIVLGNRTYKFVDNGRNGYHEVAAIVAKGQLSYPTISYVDANGMVLKAAPGYLTPDQFKVYLAFYSGEDYKTRTFEEFQATYLGNL